MGERWFSQRDEESLMTRKDNKSEETRYGNNEKSDICQPDPDLPRLICLILLFVRKRSEAQKVKARDPGNKPY
jgi:hypothetical protein